MGQSVPATISSATGSISTSFLDRVKARDAEAWRRLTDTFGSSVYHFARAAGLQDVDAENIVQDVFLAVATNVNGFRRLQPGDTFRGWLFTIARNKILDHFRRRAGQADPEGGTVGHQRLRSLAEPPESATDLTTLESAEKLAVQRAVRSIRHDFQDHTWQAFWLTTVEDKSPKEVAEQLGMTVAAVQQAKFRVKKRLREELGEC
ncbi:MAG: sigma-70 family RNA polymerase sigma factor [Planctomycetes bacterium]|nr:sigma-70 family RNA polymerase sigma factor [Planctomycetota bacterium]